MVITGTFIKTQGASFMASCIDFLVTILCREVLGFWYMAATVTGTVSGGIVSFLLGREWVFKQHNRRMQPQLVRYFLVWVGNFLLNITGVFILAGCFHVNYILSKVLISVLVGCTYNYLLQKEYVFR